VIGKITDLLSSPVLLKLLALAILLACLVSILIAEFVLPEPADKGFNPIGIVQMKSLGIVRAALIVLAVAIAALACRKRGAGKYPLLVRVRGAICSRKFLLIFVALSFTCVFFLLRNNFINYDGRAFTEKFHRDLPTKGAHVTHDEMWELYLHSRFWLYTNRYLGWSVTFSYQVLSCVAGGIFVFVLLCFCRKLLPGNPLGLFLIIASGGFMQLFFGDVENYTITAVLILSYVYSAHEHLRNGLHLVVPSLILAAAMTFHLLAGFLLPSLAYLYYLEMKKGRFKGLAVSASSFILILGLTLLFFHFHNLPIRNLYWHSHAFGHGGNFLRMFKKPSIYYHVRVVNLLILLAPVFILTVPLLFFGAIEWNRFNIFLAISCLFMIGYMFTWEARLGVYNDWNMYANAAIPISIFAGFNIMTYGREEWKQKALVPLVLLFYIHSYTWIVSNHFMSA
jgi:hypothetical protein